MTKKAIANASCFSLLLLSASCSPAAYDPFLRPGTWSPQGVNDANLKTMVANPRDLILGTSDQGTLGSEAAPPVERLLSGKRYPLPVESASGIGLGAPTAAQGGGGPSGGSSQ